MVALRPETTARLDLDRAVQLPDPLARVAALARGKQVDGKEDRLLHFSHGLCSYGRSMAKRIGCCILAIAYAVMAGRWRRGSAVAV